MRIEPGTLEVKNEEFSHFATKPQNLLLPAPLCLPAHTVIKPVNQSYIHLV